MVLPLSLDAELEQKVQGNEFCPKKDLVNLFEVEIPQKILKTGEKHVGRIPGERPTVLIGTIFYNGQKIFIDEDKRTFDRERAESLIRQQEEFSDKTGNPHVIEVVLSNSNTAGKLVEFVWDKTSAPIAIDAPSRGIHMHILRYIMDLGSRNSLIYNSLTSRSTQDEMMMMMMVKEAGFDASIVPAYNPEDLFTAKGRMTAIREIVDRARNSGLESLIADTCVLDLPTLGPALEAIKVVKQELGLPAGCGAHNAISLWKGLLTKMGPQVVKPCRASAAAVAAAFGADFVLYGPIEDAPIVFPSAAMMDAAVSQLRMERGVRIDRNHPRYRIG